MTDERLRQLERGGERARVLVERLRAGTLTIERLELAAYCGDHDARQVAATGEPEEDFHEFAHGLERWGVDVRRRAALAVARRIVGSWEEERLARARRAVRAFEGAITLDATKYPRLAIEAGEAWLACPCDEHLQRWNAAVYEVGRRLPAESRWVPCEDEVGHLHLSHASHRIPQRDARQAIERALIAWALA